MPRNGNSTKQKKSTPASDERAFYKILAAFVAAVVIEIVLVVLYRRFYAGKVDDSARAAMFTVSLIMAALCAVFVALTAVMRKKRKRLAEHFLGGSVLMLMGFAALGLLSGHGITASKLLCIACPVVLLLYIVGIIYQREFFAEAVLCAMALFALWAEKRFDTMNISYAAIAFAVTAAISVAAAVIALLARKNAGYLKIGEKRIWRIYDQSGGFVLICVTAAVMLIAVTVGFLFTAAAVEAAMFIVAAYLFVLAVYYTVRLM